MQLRLRAQRVRLVLFPGQRTATAKDITIRVTGQMVDGTLNVQQIDGSNPFMSQSSTSMVAMGQPSMVAQPQQQVGYRARIGSVDATFATEADYLKADRALREMAEAQNVPAVGGLAARSIGSSASWLRTGANAAEAVGAFLKWAEHSPQARGLG